MATLTLKRPMNDWRKAATHHTYMTQEAFNASEHAYRASQRNDRIELRNLGFAGMYKTVGRVPVYTKGR